MVQINYVEQVWFISNVLLHLYVNKSKSVSCCDPVSYSHLILELV